MVLDSRSVNAGENRFILVSNSVLKTFSIKYDKMDIGATVKAFLDYQKLSL